MASEPTTLNSINPATGETIERYRSHTNADVDRAVADVTAAFDRWRREPWLSRRSVLTAMAGRLTDRREELARLMTAEMGKPVTQARAEVDKCAWVCRYYEQHAQEQLAGEVITTDASRSGIEYRPLGPILAVMPWNFPFWQVFRFLAPALAAGNTAVLKHASNVCGCSLAIEELVREAVDEAGLTHLQEPGSALLRAVLVPGSAVSRIIEAREIRGVTVTGSVPAGRAIAAAAGAALKPSVLELGGSDPYLVLADADLELAAGVCARGRLINSGQSCIAAKRLIVHESVYGEFRELLIRELRSFAVGDPLEEHTDVGPQARADLRDELHGQVTRSVGAGATLVLGGTIPEGPGAYYPVTLLEDVAPGMPAYEEELFGPVAVLVRARDEADGVRIANDSSFGLGAAIFSRDVDRARRIAVDELDAGACFVNGLVKSDPRLPFGGVKDSGYGRELSLPGIRSFVNTKAVWVR